jgi:hypothetical protein
MAVSAGSPFARSVRFQFPRRTAAQSLIFSAQQEQDRQASSGRENGNRDPEARVIPETDFDVLARRFNHDHVGDRTDDGEVAGKRRGQRKHLPHQLGLNEVCDPISCYQHERNVRENIGTDRGKPREVLRLHCRV